MSAFLLLALALQAPDAAIDARTRRTEGIYELTVNGRLRGAPPEGSVGLRFHRVVHRASWDDGAIETVVLEDGPGRAAAHRRGAFSHAERFDAPGEVELRLLADGFAEPARRTLRVGSTADLVAASAAGLKKIETAVAEIERVVEETLQASSEGGVEARRARDVRRKAERRLAAVRSLGEKAWLNAAGGALSALASDVEGALTARLDGRPACRWMSSLTERTFRLEETAEYVERLRDLAVREARLIRVREIAALQADTAAGIEAGDVRRFERLQAVVRKGLEALRSAEDGALAESLDDLDRLLDLGAAALMCDMGAPEDWEAFAAAAAERLQELESTLRRG